MYLPLASIFLSFSWKKKKKIHMWNYLLASRSIWFSYRFDQDFSRDPELLDECQHFIDEFIAKDDEITAQTLSKLLEHCVLGSSLFFHLELH